MSSTDISKRKRSSKSTKRKPSFVASSTMIGGFVSPNPEEPLLNYEVHYDINGMYSLTLYFFGNEDWKPSFFLGGTEPNVFFKFMQYNRSVTLR